MADNRKILPRSIQEGRFEWFHPVRAGVGASMQCRRQTTRPYWLGHVYDWLTGRTHAVHLGRDERLTADYLDERAEALASKIRGHMPGIPRRVRCPRCGR